MEFEAEAGFNLCKVRRCGRNIIGQRATVTVPGQRGANITMCAAISNDGVLCHIPTIGPYNTERLITFLDALKKILIPPEERGLLRPGMALYVIIWDNVAFHHSRLVNEWFAAQPRIMMQFLPAYSPFLNSIEEFFSAWRWKVYDHRPYEQMPLLEAMNAGCLAIGAEDCQGWIRHARRYFPRCIANQTFPGQCGQSKPTLNPLWAPCGLAHAEPMRGPYQFAQLGPNGDFLSCVLSCGVHRETEIERDSLYLEYNTGASQTKFANHTDFHLVLSAKFSSSPNHVQLIQLIKVFRITTDFQAGVWTDNGTKSRLATASEMETSIKMPQQYKTLGMVEGAEEQRSGRALLCHAFWTVFSFTFMFVWISPPFLSVPAFLVGGCDAFAARQPELGATGLEEDTIRCDLPICNYPLIKLINVVLYLNGSDFEVEECHRSNRPTPSEARRVVSGNDTSGTPACRANGSARQSRRKQTPLVQTAIHLLSPEPPTVASTWTPPMAHKKAAKRRRRRERQRFLNQVKLQPRLRSQVKLQLRFPNQINLPLRARSPVTLQLCLLSRVKLRLCFLSQVTLQLHVLSQVKQVAAAFPESSHISESSQVATAFPESSQVSESSQVAAAVPGSNQVSESSQVTAVFLESSQVSESSQATAAVPESSRDMAATPESSKITAVISVSNQVTTVFPGSSRVKAGFPVSRQVKAALPKSSQATAVFPLSSQVTVEFPVSSQVTAVFPRSSKTTAVVPVSSKVRAVFPVSSLVRAALPESNKVTTMVPESSQDRAVVPELTQPTHPCGAHKGCNWADIWGPHGLTNWEPANFVLSFHGGPPWPVWAPDIGPVATLMGPTWMCWLGSQVRAVIPELRKKTELLFLSQVKSQLVSTNQIKSSLILVSQVKSLLVSMSQVESLQSFTSQVKPQLMPMSQVRPQPVTMNQVKPQLVFMSQVKSKLIFMSQVKLLLLSQSQVTCRLSAQSQVTSRLSAQSQVTSRLSAQSLLTSRLSTQSLLTSRLSVQSLLTSPLSAQSLVTTRLPV
ncbi:Variable charge X-linked protein 3B [Labeo rohita]|uniref:Variable charge X-linked protein 3B n=1 Tax=Labeo rohita TaxID=84645 RepID=A0ABQ8L269_LABRO|nr:Variable charge X-linked protein 3B [Labeo rohita]